MLISVNVPKDLILTSLFLFNSVEIIEKNLSIKEDEKFLENPIVLKILFEISFLVKFFLFIN